MDDPRSRSGSTEDILDGGDPDAKVHGDKSKKPLHYVGFVSVNSCSGNEEVMTAFCKLTDKDSPTFVHPSDHRRVVLRLSPDSVEATERGSDAEVLHTSLRDVSQVTLGPRKGSLRSFFGYITPNYIESMLVGYHCHVFRTDKRTVSEGICRDFGQAFSSRANLLQVPLGARHRGDSVSSATSRDSAIAQPTSSSRENLTGHDSFSSSYDAMHESPMPQRVALRRSSTGDCGLSDNPFLPSHRRTYSEDSIQDPPPLDLSMDPGPSLLVSPPEDGGAGASSSEAAAVSSGYLVRQTGQNLYRRLLRTRLPLIKDHRIKQKTYRSCFNAREVVTWLVEEQKDFATAEDAVAFMQELLKSDVIRPVAGDHTEFRHDNLLFRFKGEGSRSRSGSTSKVAETAGDGGNRSRSGSTGKVPEMADLFAVESDPEDGSGSLSSDPQKFRNVETDTATSDQEEPSGTGVFLRAVTRNDTGALTSAFRGARNQPSMQNLAVLLHRAVKASAVEVARVLIDNGANVNHPTDSGDTPLHRAAARGSSRMVALLLEKGARVDARNINDGTPLLRAAARPNNFECCILLLEHGAVLARRDYNGRSAVDLMPDLEEIQQRLCSSAGDSLASPGQQEEALQAIVSLCVNEECHGALVQQLRRPDCLASLTALNRDNSRAPELTKRVIDKMLAPMSQRSTDALVAVVQLAGIAGGVRDHAMQFLLQTAESEATSGLSRLASADLDILTAFCSDGVIDEPTKAAARIFSLVSRLPAGRRRLGQPPTVRKLVEGATVLASAMEFHQGSDPVVADILACVANVVQGCPADLNPLRKELVAAMQSLLGNTSPAVGRQAARCLVYLGETDTGAVRVFGAIDGEAAPYRGRDDLFLQGAGASDAPWVAGDWSAVKGASLEAMVSAMTEPAADGKAPACRLVFVAYQRFFHPLAVLRMLLHRFKDEALVPSTDDVMPPLHNQVLGLLRGWLQVSLSDFLQTPLLLREFKAFLLMLQCHGGVYQQVVESLMDMSINAPQDTTVPCSGIRSYDDAEHHRLYAKAKHAVLSGEVVVSQEMAVPLAATQVHVDDLMRLSQFGNTQIFRDGMPTVKPKNILPPEFHKKQYFKVIIPLVEVEYRKVAKLRHRDAAHYYLRLFRLATLHQCDYFDVKLINPDSKRKTPCVLGIGQERVIIVDDQSKKINRAFRLVDLRRWDVGKRQTTSKLLPGASAKKGSLVLSFRTADVTVSADSDTLKKISETFLTAIEKAKKLAGEDATAGGEKQGDAGPAPVEMDAEALAALSIENTASVTSPSVSATASENTTAQATPVSSQNPSPMYSPSTTPNRSPVMPRRAFGSARTDSNSTVVDGGSRSRAGSKGDGQPRSRAGTNHDGLGWPRANSKDEDAGLAEPTTASRAMPRITVGCHCPPTPAFDNYFDMRHLSSYSVLEIPVEAARQLTLIEHELYKAISAKDCLNRIWRGGKKSKNAAKPSEASDRNTVTAFIDRFNLVSGWAACLVLNEDQMDVRVSAIEALIEMAKQCLKFRNFNGVMEIVSALGSSSVRRLTHTWAGVCDESMITFRELESIMAPEDSFSEYRARLSKARPPAVPYFGVFLRDLTLLHEGNMDFQARGLVNTGKMVLMLNHLKEMERLQQSNYNFLIVPQIGAFLREIEPAESEPERHLRSRAIQPPPQLERRTSRLNMLSR